MRQPSAPARCWWKLLLAPVLALMLMPPVPARAQLRPLDPLPWGAMDDTTALVAEGGLGLFTGQRASLAGTRGRLLEIGNFQLAWRSGRFALELAGTAQRVFDDRERFAPPTGGAAATGPRRGDVGDVRIGTLLRLTPERFAVPVVLRFGTRLPTTSNDEGLDRDQTDFYSTVGAAIRRGGMAMGAEAGVGLHGTRDLQFEQADVFLFSATAEYHRFPLLVPAVALAGQRNGTRGWRLRGNEDLSELRIGARTRGPVGVRAEWVRGLTEFSPSSGVRVGVIVARE